MQIQLRCVLEAYRKSWMAFHLVTLNLTSDDPKPNFASGGLFFRPRFLVAISSETTGSSRLKFYGKVGRSTSYSKVELRMRAAHVTKMVAVFPFSTLSALS